MSGYALRRRVREVDLRPLLSGRPAGVCIRAVNGDPEHESCMRGPAAALPFFPEEDAVVSVTAAMTPRRAPPIRKGRSRARGWSTARIRRSAISNWRPPPSAQQLASSDWPTPALGKKTPLGIFFTVFFRFFFRLFYFLVD